MYQSCMYPVNRVIQSDPSLESFRGRNDGPSWKEVGYGDGILQAGRHE